ncbi:MAG: GLPGLI family protein [Chitinophagaceae bacterium]|nr:GLPGLI family protein [Chitinophagaceae bacterium]MBL0131255.1 GLPGLI family protein [Chitinophagaceae bacterium]MBL0273215.1 GLPGLI family protein [Chitinophagaceae bacterium]
MIKRILLFVTISLVIKNVFAQARFFATIKVEYVKTTSVRQLMKELQEGNSWYEQNKERYPVSMVSYHEFTGDTSKSLYQPGKDVPVDPRSWYRPMADKNIVYTDYKRGISISQKPVFEETMLVEDSLLKIKWKITADVRTIAGYDCHKAVGILNDSIAIFAFYTDELLICGGPEGIQGLPGMILGMGIPRLHATWFASKVEVFDVKMNKVIPATKGKKVNRTALMEILEKASKDWGTNGKKQMLNFII